MVQPHFGLRPGLTHSALAAIPTLLGCIAGNAWIGAAFAIGFYVGRERKQSEYYYRDTMLEPWVWQPRAWRDMGWPTLTALAIATVWEVVL